MYPQKRKFIIPWGAEAKELAYCAQRLFLKQNVYLGICLRFRFTTPHIFHPRCLKGSCQGCGNSDHHQFPHNEERLWVVQEREWMNQVSERVTAKRAQKGRRVLTTASGGGSKDNKAASWRCHGALEKVTAKTGNSAPGPRQVRSGPSVSTSGRRGS